MAIGTARGRSRVNPDDLERDAIGGALDKLTALQGEDPTSSMPKETPDDLGITDLGGGAQQRAGAVGSGLGGTPAGVRDSAISGLDTGVPDGGGSALGSDADVFEKKPDLGAVPSGPQATTQPIGDPAALGDEAGADVPAAAVPGGAAARYGTEDIPGAETLQWGDTQRVRGFNTGQWGSGARGSNTIKNSFGKIASRYDPGAPQATQQIVNDPDFKRLFPEATIVPHPKGDLIDFGDGVGVDVLINANENGAGEAWAFQVPGGGTAQPGGGASVGLQGGGVPALTDESILAEILASVDALAKGEEDPLVKKSIAEQLAQLSPEMQATVGNALSGETTGAARRTGGVR